MKVRITPVVDGASRTTMAIGELVKTPPGTRAERFANATIDGVAAAHRLPDFLPDYVVYDRDSTRSRPRLLFDGRRRPPVHPAGNATPRPVHTENRRNGHAGCQQTPTGCGTPAVPAPRSRSSGAVPGSRVRRSARRRPPAPPMPSGRPGSAGPIAGGGRRYRSTCCSRGR